MAGFLHLGDTQDRSVQEELQFEYLKNWISSVHHRMISDNVSCPFKSLALGISHAYREVAESQIRAALIETYLKLDGAVLDALAREKLQHETSFFYMTQFRDVEEVKKYWPWYLYCLSFESCEFEDSNFPENGTVVKIPMDYIDLQVLAICLRAKFVVSHLDSPALCFNPRTSEVRFHLDLVHHKSRWAPVLGRKPSVKALENQLVILQGLDGSGFQSFKNKPAYVLAPPRACAGGSDVYWVNVGQQRLPMQRHHLHVIDGADASSQAWQPTGVAKWQGPALGQASSFRGIPDGSVEFQLLLQLVGDLVFKRLRQKREEYQGNDVDWTRAAGDRDYAAALPAHCWTNCVAAKVERRFATEWRPLVGVVNFMNARKEQGQKSWIGVWCPTTFHKNSAELEEHFRIPVRRGLHLILRKAVPHQELDLLFEAAVDGEQQKGWFIADLLCLWEVRSPMMAESQGRSPVMLQLEAGARFYVTELLENGWAKMCQWRDDEDQALAKRGVFHLRNPNLHPWLCVRKGDLPTVQTMLAKAPGATEAMPAMPPWGLKSSGEIPNRNPPEKSWNKILKQYEDETIKYNK